MELIGQSIVQTAQDRKKWTQIQVHDMMSRTIWQKRRTVKCLVVHTSSVTLLRPAVSHTVSVARQLYPVNYSQATPKENRFSRDDRGKYYMLGFENHLRSSCASSPMKIAYSSPQPTSTLPPCQGKLSWGRMAGNVMQYKRSQLHCGSNAWSILTKSQDELHCSPVKSSEGWWFYDHCELLQDFSHEMVVVKTIMGWRSS